MNTTRLQTAHRFENVGGEKGVGYGIVMTSIALEHTNPTTRRIECTQRESGQRRPVSCNDTTRPTQDRNHCGAPKLMPTKGRAGTNGSVVNSVTTGMLSRVSLISPDTKPRSQSRAPSVRRGLSYGQVQSATRSCSRQLSIETQGTCSVSVSVSSLHSYTTRMLLTTPSVSVYPTGSFN